MTDGLAAVQSRIAELQSRLGVAASGGASSGAVLGGSAISTSTGASTLDLSGTSGTSSEFATQLAGLLSSATGSSDGSSGTATSTVDLGAAAVAKAKQYYGMAYKWGGEDPSTGMDCSGLTQYVYGTLGIDLPRVAADQSKAGRKVASLSDARPGDLVFFGSPATHVGIYAGNGMMIDAPRTGKTIGLHKLWGTPSAIRRVVPEVDTSTVSASSVSTGSVGTGNAVSGPYASLFTAAGRKYGVDPALLSAVARTESAYNPKAVSPAGAGGLMQLMPATAKSLGVNRFDPEDAVDGAARMLAGLIKDFNGNTDLAIAGYNAGAGAVRKYGGIPPYEETQNYVKKVNRYWKELS